jgi:hypothetical protein
LDRIWPGAAQALAAVSVAAASPWTYPKLRLKFGNLITYADDPFSHLKTEFGFDVFQAAKGRYAPDGYKGFIGFEVSKPVLERAFGDKPRMGFNSGSACCRRPRAEVKELDSKGRAKMKTSTVFAIILLLLGSWPLRIKASPTRLEKKLLTSVRST